MLLLLLLKRRHRVHYDSCVPLPALQYITVPFLSRRNCLMWSFVDVKMKISQLDFYYYFKINDFAEIKYVWEGEQHHGLCCRRLSSWCTEFKLHALILIEWWNILVCSFNVSIDELKLPPVWEEATVLMLRQRHLCCFAASPAEVSTITSELSCFVMSLWPSRGGSESLWCPVCPQSSMRGRPGSCEEAINLSLLCSSTFAWFDLFPVTCSLPV